jgi:hemolysin activation/secretion protein
VDYGSAWNNKVETPFPRYLASVGVGLRWSILPQDRARFEVYWGKPLNHFGTSGHNLQDYGIHFQLVVQAF